jgi:phosphomannomutase
MFHGLRPLRFVLDTRSEPFLRQLHELGARAACEVLRPESSETSASGAERPFVLRRLEIVGRRVVEHATHFGRWISGDGEACRLVDERGKSVPGEALFMMLAKYICGQKPGATLIVEREIHSSLARELKLLDARTLRADSTRQATSEAIERTGAVFGGGTSGRFWYAGQPAAPDALMTLALVLTILSQSDRPLSEVLDAA